MERKGGLEKIARCGGHLLARCGLASEIHLSVTINRIGLLSPLDNKRVTENNGT